MNTRSLSYFFVSGGLRDKNAFLVVLICVCPKMLYKGLYNELSNRSPKELLNIKVEED